MTPTDEQRLRDILDLADKTIAACQRVRNMTSPHADVARDTLDEIPVLQQVIKDKVAQLLP